MYVQPIGHRLFISGIMKTYLHRINLTLKRDLACFWRHIIIFITCLFLILTVGDILIAYTQAGKSTMHISDSIMVFNIITLMIAASILPSTAFRDLGSQGTCHFFLMLPASSSEKFMSRWLIFIPGTVLVCYLTAFVSALASAALSILMQDIEESVFMTYLTHLLHPTFLTTIFFIQSVFLLGSSLWPRFSWPKTFVMTILLATLCIIIMVMTFRHLGFTENTLLLPFGKKIGGKIIMWAITFINYTLCCMRVKETDLTNHP